MKQLLSTKRSSLETIYAEGPDIPSKLARNITHHTNSKLSRRHPHNKTNTKCHTRLVSARDKPPHNIPSPSLSTCIMKGKMHGILLSVTQMKQHARLGPTLARAEGLCAGEAIWAGQDMQTEIRSRIQDNPGEISLENTQRLLSTTRTSIKTNAQELIPFSLYGTRQKMRKQGQLRKKHFS